MAPRGICDASNLPAKEILMRLRTDYFMELMVHLQTLPNTPVMNWRFQEVGPRIYVNGVSTAGGHIAELNVNGQAVATGTGSTKSQARQDAAKNYLDSIRERSGGGSNFGPEPSRERASIPEDIKHIYRPPGSPVRNDLDEAALADATSDFLPAEDLSALAIHLPEGGCLATFHVPTRAIDWLAQNEDHTLLDEIRDASILGPFPYMLHTFTDALALCPAIADSIRLSTLARRLSEVSGLNVITLPNGSMPAFDLDGDKPGSAPFRLRGGAGNSSSGYGDEDNGHTAEESTHSDDDHTSNNSHAMDVDSMGASHNIDVEQGLLIPAVHASEITDPHECDINIALTSSTSIEVHFKFWFGDPPPSASNLSYPGDDADFQSIAIYVQDFVAETQGGNSFIEASSGIIGLLGPECTDVSLRKDLQFFGRDFIPLNHARPDRTHKDTAKKSTQGAIEGTLAVNPGGKIGIVKQSEKGTEDNDATPGPKWVVDDTIAAPPTLKTRSLRSMSMVYTMYPEPMLMSPSLRVSFGIRSRLRRTKAVKIFSGISFVMRNKINMWIQPSQGGPCYVPVEMITRVDDIYTPKRIIIPGEVSAEEAVLEPLINKKGEHPKRDKAVKYLSKASQKVLGHFQAGPSTETALSRDAVNNFEGLEPEANHTPNFTNALIYWKRVESFDKKFSIAFQRCFDEDK